MRNIKNIVRSTFASPWRAPLVIATLLGMSGTAQADPPWAQRGYYGYGGYEVDYGYRHGHHRYCPERALVVEQRYYYPEERVYYAPPQVVYVPQQPTYYQAPAYQNPGYQTYGPPAATYPSYGNSGGYNQGGHLVSSAVLGAAGGLLGSQVGRGSGRAAATAAGAVAGWVFGDRFGW